MSRREQLVLIRGADGVTRAVNRATGTTVYEFTPDEVEHDDRLKGWSLFFVWCGFAVAGWLALYLGAHLVAAYLRSIA